MRVVLDTNGHVSATIKEEGHPGQIIKAWREGQFELLISEFILKETDEVLHRERIFKKYHLTEDKIERTIRVLRRYAVKTPGKLQLKVIENDPNDDYILACAVEGEADYIVSGDHHLRDLKAYQGIEVLTPSAFLKLLREDKTA